MNIIHKELFIALIYLVSLLTTFYFIKDKKKRKITTVTLTMIYLMRFI